MSENTSITQRIIQSTSRNFQKTIDRSHTYSAIKAYRIIGIFILIALLIPSASAAITQWQITPENPVMGDVVAVTGHAAPSEVINAKAVFTDTTISANKDGKFRYEYTISKVKIPDGDNRFTVNANGVNDIYIKVQLSGIPIWSPSLGNDGATISQSNIPGGTYNIRIYGIATDSTAASTVTLEIIAQQPITADSNGKFVYNYDSSSTTGITPGRPLSVTMNGLGPISDTTVPSLSINNPVNGVTVTTSQITISGTASDNVALKNVKVNGIIATGTTSWNAKVTLTEGSNTITAIATDTSDITNTETITVTYTPTTDTYTPTVVITTNDTTDTTINTTLDEITESNTLNTSSESLKKDGTNNTAVTPAKSNQTQAQTSLPEKSTTPTKVASARYISVTIVAIFGFIYIMKRRI